MKEVNKIPSLSALLILDDEPVSEDSADTYKSLHGKGASLEVGGSIVARGRIKRRFGKLNFVVQEVYQ